MAVTSPASLSKIIAEFNGPSNLKAYNKGGTHVPNTAANAAVSTDPNLLAISQFVGAVASVSPTVAMPDLTGYSQSSAGTVSCALVLQTGGGYLLDTSAFDPTGTYLTAGVASDVDVYVTATGDTVSGSAVNTWLNLGTQRSWTLSRGTNGSSFTTLNLTFRNKNTLAQLDTATVTLELWRGTLQ